MAAEIAPDSKVYRLQGIPGNLDRLGVAQLLVGVLPDGSLADITVASLAWSCDFWARSHSKTATVTFSKLPKAVQAAPSAKEWMLSSPGLPRGLVLDDAFYGLTPLNDVPSGEHEYDCIVISGLSSHPMGSWQPHGQEKNYMWIRDALPSLVPSARFILYGYDTTLIGSKSIQDVSDLAVSLINELKACGWTSPSAKSLVFLAHSLGGVVLKQTILMLAGSGVREESILVRTKGAIFFGVPSQGMRLSDIFTMLKFQPNKEALIRCISDESPFLPQLERQVSGLSWVRRIRFFWAYETQTTPTLVEVDGKYQRSGPETVLVSKHSATGGRCDSDPTAIIQIDANHSNMVKFSPGHHSVTTITHSLREIFENKYQLTEGQFDLSEETGPFVIPHWMDTATMNAVGGLSDHDPTWVPDFWDVNSITSSLRGPDRDRRLDQIDERVGHSFEWVFHRPSVGLTRWLQKGDGIFWISGRPASGKSTMMKFLNNDLRTWQLLRGWNRSAHKIRASFFFHHRGTAAQKSFEGLIRSILSQLLENDPTVFNSIIPIFRDRYQEVLQEKKLGNLRSDLGWLITVNELRLDSLLVEEVTSILEGELPREMLRRIVIEPMGSMDGMHCNWNAVERAVLARKEAIVRTANLEQLRAMNPSVYQVEWKEDTITLFLSLLAEWRDAVDLRRKLWNMKSLPRHLPPRGSAESARMQQLARQIDAIVQRQRAREFVRSTIEAESWTIARLDQAFKSILGQGEHDLDLFLFLDALDEYDGPVEFISEFLKDLVKDRENLRTRVRILFSSRPWNVFLEEFADCPGFRIHEHTENDIRELCAATIKTDMPGSREILQLAGEIVQRARGVFLWVKLVLDDMSNLAMESVSKGISGKDLRTTLLKCLELLPRDLIDYYAVIIERIPPPFRWETYCLLESVCRSSELLIVDQLPSLLACSSITSFSRLQENMHSSHSVSEEDAESQLQAACGGLAEVFSTMIGLFRVRQVQLLHQTVLDFVEQPQFKQIALGSMSHITEENGHTFMTKYLLYRDKCQVSVPLLQHARQSERTTGASLHGLFSNGAFNFPGYLVKNSQQISADVSCIGLAVAGQLHLCLKDALQKDENAVSKASDPFLSLIMWSFDRGLCDAGEAATMVQFLTAHGFRPENDLDGLCKIISRDPNNPSFYKAYDLDAYEQVIMAVFGGGWINLEIDLSIPKDILKSHSDISDFKMLHLSSPRLALHLLERGANPNSTNSEGMTPLDAVLKLVVSGHHRFVFQRTLADAHMLCNILIQRGGLLCKADRQHWNIAIAAWKAASLDVSHFAEKGFPKWLESGGGASGLEYIKEFFGSIHQAIKRP